MILAMTPRRDVDRAWLVLRMKNGKLHQFDVFSEWPLTVHTGGPNDYLVAIGQGRDFQSTRLGIYRWWRKHSKEQQKEILSKSIVATGSVPVIKT